MRKNRKTLLLENCLKKHMRFNNEWGILESTIRPDKLNRNTYERVDGLSIRVVDDKNIWTCYEIKSSELDFNSNACLTFVGHLNYFIMEEKLYDTVNAKLPKHVGVLILKYRSDKDDHILECIKKPTKCKLQVDESELHISLHRSFNRELLKRSKRKNQKITA